MQNKALMTSELTASPQPNKLAASVAGSSKEQSVSFEETLSKQLQQHKTTASKTDVKSAKSADKEQEAKNDATVANENDGVEKSVKKEEKKPVEDGNNLPITEEPSNNETAVTSKVIDIESENPTGVALANTEELIENSDSAVSSNSDKEIQLDDVEASASKVLKAEAATHSTVSAANASSIEASTTAKESKTLSNESVAKNTPVDGTLKSTLTEVAQQKTEQESGRAVLSEAQSRDKDFVLKQIKIAAQATNKVQQSGDAVLANKNQQSVSQVSTTAVLSTEKQHVGIDLARHITNQVGNKNTRQQPNLPFNAKSDSGIDITKVVEGAAASTKQLKEVSLTGAQREQILLDKAALGDGVIVKTIKPELASAATVLSNTSASTSTIASNASATSPQLMPMLDVQPTLKSEAWGKVMVGRVIWMAKEGVQTAQLKLNPAQLGPVEVRVTLNNDQASVSFVAQHVTTRDTLEQALPRLRESFQANGMALANADVSDQPASQQFDQHHDKQQGDIIFSQSDEEVDELVDNKAVIEETKPGLSLYV
jgi:flagellar hook-length control protein FliK